MSSSLEIGTVRNFRLSNIGSVYYFYNLKTPCTNKMENKINSRPDKCTKCLYNMFVKIKQAYRIQVLVLVGSRKNRSDTTTQLTQHRTQ